MLGKRLRKSDKNPTFRLQYHEAAKKDLTFVSIIVVVLNMEKTIGACLSSLESLNYPRDRFEIIVVDGGSTDRTPEICQEFDVHFIVEKRRGRGLARNVGIAHSQGEIIAFIDADCEASKDWLSLHVASHREELVGAVGGAVINPYLGVSGKPAILSHFEYFAEFDEKSRRRHMYHVPTCNASFKRKILLGVGCFDEELDMYEDFLVSRKITDAGYKILFEPSASVLHLGVLPQTSLRSYLVKEQKMGEAHFRAQKVNKFIFGRLPMEKIAALLFTPLIILLRAVRELYKLLRVPSFAVRAFSCLPVLFMGSISWGVSYVKASFSSGKN